MLSFAAAALLFGVEFGNYLVGTDFGTTDYLPAAWSHNHPQCKDVGGQYDVRCPFPGYNSVRLICLTPMCTYSDPQMATVTDEMRDAQIAMLLKDKTDSLQVEEPYAGKSIEWRERAGNLRSGKLYQPDPVVLDRAPQTLPETLAVVRWRAQHISHQVAEDWLKQHGQ